jgi:hypothetical protein
MRSQEAAQSDRKYTLSSPLLVPFQFVPTNLRKPNSVSTLCKTEGVSIASLSWNGTGCNPSAPVNPVTLTLRAWAA